MQISWQSVSSQRQKPRTRIWIQNQKTSISSSVSLQALAAIASVDFISSWNWLSNKWQEAGATTSEQWSRRF